MIDKKLKVYKSKRSSSKTPEPFTSKDIHPSKLYFVIQKHKATALHYDFRLEIGDVMPSWAVPKGPSLDNSVKRLAQQTEDHPLDYRHFEGVIPEGEYGGGPVIIWDEGTYYPEIQLDNGTRKEIKDKREGEKVMEEGLKKGEIKFFLNGKKLRGSFALVKTNGFPPGKKNSWLMIKHKDKYIVPNFDAANYPKSVKTGKTIEDLEIMIIKNLSRNTVITKDLKIASSLKDKALGLLNPKNPRSLLIKTRFGIHTLFLKNAIDVLVLDKSSCVKAAKILHPNSFYLYNPAYQTVIELPSGTIKKSKTQIGDKLKMLK